MEYGSEITGQKFNSDHLRNLILTIYKRFNSSKSIFANCRDSISTSSDLAIEYAQKIVDKYQDQ